MKKIIVSVALLVFSLFTYSEDIELYISDAVKQASQKTQVLIIFDNSGSMDTEEIVKVNYNPNTNYPAVAGHTKFTEDYLYYKRDGGTPTPDDNGETRLFLSSINSCETAKNILATNGIYTGHIRRYRFSGNTGEWKNIPKNNGSKVKQLGCEDDVLNEVSINAAPLLPGYPVNGLGDQLNPVYFTENVANSNVSWSGGLVTLYTANYLRWYHGVGSEETSRQRMDMAKESITNVILSAPSIDFGLQIFNRNSDSSNSGGRIISGIKEMTDTNQTNFLNLIDGLVPETWTPLCENLYEASRYFSGESIYYGDDDDGDPSRDTSIESGGKYISPFNDCYGKAYVILITDGAPTRDNNADNLIKGMSVVENGNTINFSGTPFEISGESDNYLALLAGWMSDHDVNPNVDGKQTVSTYTIGFSSGADDAAPLLIEAANLGGGKYFPAQDTASLTEALTTVLQSLEPSNDSLTSASVAANNFDRTETLNSVYYAMFQPNQGPRWQGNLKKYKVIDGVQVGKNGKSAIDAVSGHFSEDVTSFWSSTVDGDQVSEGGVADMLREKTNRVVYSNLGSGGALVDFNKTNAETAFGGSAELAAELESTESEVEGHINWALGIDVDDEDNNLETTMRYDAFGDPLHSKPVVINYGDSIRLVIGTNSGALHMFEDSGNSVNEDWAFMPKEFFSNIKPLRENYATEDKIYGIDGKITSYINDSNGDGIVNGSDTVWIFFGLRRGGTSYYAVDVTSPSSPSLMWHINADSSGFGELGQSWSQPKIAFSKLNTSGNNASPVLIFGGGYDVSKDNSGVGSADSVGRAIYMVDAATGALKWSMAPSGGTTVFAGTDSIPSSIGILDSDGDGLADRLYTGDTGGNVWRVDMPSDAPNGSEPWTVFKLASLGSDAAGDNANDRRFFNEPSIVRTFISETLETTVTDVDGNTTSVISQQEKPYDAILLGSGDRSNPLGTDTNDIFFMLKDENIKTMSFSENSVPPMPLTPIMLTDLYDYTGNPVGDYVEPLSPTEEANLDNLKRDISLKNGWFIDLTQNGEKSSASALVINGVVYFTSYTPPSLGGDSSSCELPNGKGWLYAVDLALGTKIYNWLSEDSKNRDDTIAYISEQHLGSPTVIVVRKDDGDPDTIDEADGNIIVGRKIIDVGFKLQTMRTYLYVTED